jgi:hypothetical protein
MFVFFLRHNTYVFQNIRTWNGEAAAIRARKISQPRKTEALI